MEVKTTDQGIEIPCTNHVMHDLITWGYQPVIISSVSIVSFDRICLGGFGL